MAAPGKALESLTESWMRELDNQVRKWEKTFPDELWLEFARLTGWKGTVSQRPKYWGHLVNELVYQYLDEDVYRWLKENAPTPRHGQNYHQWLSSQYGGGFRNEAQRVKQSGSGRLCQAP